MEFTVAESCHAPLNAVPTHSETLPVQFAVLADDGKVAIKLSDCVASCTPSAAAQMGDSAYGDGERPVISSSELRTTLMQVLADDGKVAVKWGCASVAFFVAPGCGF